MTVVVVMGVRGAGTPHGATLQGEDGAVRRRRGAGLRRHLLVGGQLEGSQKTCGKSNPADQLRFKVKGQNTGLTCCSLTKPPRPPEVVWDGSPFCSQSEPNVENISNIYSYPI